MDISTPPAPGTAARPLWRFGDGVTYLNHGAFGATPGVVLDAQAAWRDRIESAPGPFFAFEMAEAVRNAAAAVAPVFGARGTDLAFVDNATTGVNAVLRSLPLAAGDEVLITSHTYGAIRNAAAYAARRAGARVVEAVLPFPVPEPAAVVDAVVRALTPRTRLAILDHVVSETAHVLPVAKLTAACKARGVPVLIDGAHAPGMVALDIPALGADWYAGNLHKWYFAARSCGFLWAAPEAQADLHPPVISWGLDQGFAPEFDWVGTRDPTAWLTAPDAIAFMDHLGAERVRRHNRDLVRAAGRRLADRWGTEPVTPDAMIGSMLIVPLPDGFGATAEDGVALNRRLWREHRIHSAFLPIAGRLWVRLSAQVYNTPEDFERLGDAIIAP